MTNIIYSSHVHYFRLAYTSLPIENLENSWFHTRNCYAQIHSPPHLKKLSFELGSNLRLAEGASHFPATSTQTNNGEWVLILYTNELYKASVQKIVTTGKIDTKTKGSTFYYKESAFTIGYVKLFNSNISHSNRSLYYCLF